MRASAASCVSSSGARASHASSSAALDRLSSSRSARALAPRERRPGLRGMRRGGEGRRPLLAGREPQRVREALAGDGRRTARGDHDRALEAPVLVGQHERAVVVVKRDLARRHDAVLDLEQVGEVGVDLHRHAQLADGVAVVGDGDLLHPHVVDEPPAHDRAGRGIVGAHAGREEEAGGVVRVLVEAEQLQRRRVDAQDPARDEAGVLREEAVLAPLVGAHVAEAVADEERAAVQDAQRALRQAPQRSRRRRAASPSGTSARRRRRPRRRRSAARPSRGSRARAISDSRPTAAAIAASSSTRNPVVPSITSSARRLRGRRSRASHS